MFSVLSHLRSNRRYIEIATNLGTKYSKRLISSNFQTNCIENNTNFGFNPKISNKIIDNHRKTDPILDKWDINKIYILMNPMIKTPIKRINAIVLPDLSAFTEVDKNQKRITDSESEVKAIKDMPSPTKPIKMYCDYRIIRDPRSYTHLTIIRRHKMNKHKRLKWRKKMLAFLKKKFLKRNIKTEKLFRAELLAQIKEAEEFDAEKYVRTILETIDNVPKPETPVQKIEKIRELIRNNRRETNLISPKFD